MKWKKKTGKLYSSYVELRQYSRQRGHLYDYVVYANGPQEEKTKILTKKYIQNNELFMKMVNFLKMEALPSLFKIISVFHKFS